jgi:hypothetical protein
MCDAGFLSLRLALSSKGVDTSTEGEQHRRRTGEPSGNLSRSCGRPVALFGCLALTRAVSALGRRRAKRGHPRGRRRRRCGSRRRRRRRCSSRRRRGRRCSSRRRRGRRCSSRRRCCLRRRGRCSVIRGRRLRGRSIAWGRRRRCRCPIVRGWHRRRLSIAPRRRGHRGCSVFGSAVAIGRRFVATIFGRTSIPAVAMGIVVPHPIAL